MREGGAWCDAQETDGLITPAPRAQARADIEPTREGSCPQLALAQVMVLLSCMGLLISTAHLCFAIHDDALESARAYGYEKGRAEAPTWPENRRGRVPVSWWVTCLDFMVQSRELRLSLNSSEIALQVSKDLSQITITDDERERRWARIMGSLRNASAHLAKVHPNFATPIEHVERIQNEHEQGIQQIAEVLQQIANLQEQQDAEATRTNATNAAFKSDAQQDAHALYDEKIRRDRKATDPYPVADQNATSRLKSPDPAWPVSKDMKTWHEERGKPEKRMSMASPSPPGAPSSPAPESSPNPPGLSENDDTEKETLGGILDALR